MVCINVVVHDIIADYLRDAFEDAEVRYNTGWSSAIEVAINSKRVLLDLRSDRAVVLYERIPCASRVFYYRSAILFADPRLFEKLREAVLVECDLISRVPCAIS
jgi:hypothetical protein